MGRMCGGLFVLDKIAHPRVCVAGIVVDDLPRARMLERARAACQPCPINVKQILVINTCRFEFIVKPIIFVVASRNSRGCRVCFETRVRTIQTCSKGC